MRINLYLLRVYVQKDMLNIASKTAEVFKDSFSLEMWGGATFDVAYNFLKENPWERLENLEKRFQMYYSKCY